ncbi:MAG: 50S ribosomal protein L15 [Dehalococcoidia bacterium]|nr:50S ribosomal protein L15 [Dehalococcoidia bacterium]MQG16426.1 50S ribosomal protein L15 [SAR202 cluster bacterium]
MSEKSSLKLEKLSAPKGSKRPRKRVGRGDGSGHGSFSGKGMKGQKSRSGGGVRVGFQGGQLALIKSLPMIRGFTARNHKSYQLVNLDQLMLFDAGSEINAAMLEKVGLIKDASKLVKILGRGDCEKPINVQATRFSDSARKKIEEAGGTAREVI